MMTVWNSLTSRHRGDDTEKIINYTNEEYERLGLALIKKMPVPIKVIDMEKGMIKKAFFEEKSIVDYMGICQGYSICFDSKETLKKSLPLSNIHYHQIEYMHKFKKQGGYSFIIVNFKEYKRFFLVGIEVILDYYNKSLEGGRKSIPYKDMDDRYEINMNKNGVLDYMAALNRYIVDADKKKL